MFTLPILGGGARRTHCEPRTLGLFMRSTWENRRIYQSAFRRLAARCGLLGDRRQVKSKRDTERRVGATQL